MPKFIVSDNFSFIEDRKSEKSLFRLLKGGIISEEVAGFMKDQFKDFSVGNSEFVELSIDLLLSFLGYVFKLDEKSFAGASPWDKYSLGLYIFIGRPDSVATSNLQLVIEPIAFRNSFPGHNVNHEKDKFMLINNYKAIGVPYIKYDSSSGKGEAEAAVKEKDNIDPSPTKVAFVDFELFENFTVTAQKNGAEKVIFDFARNEKKGRLTTIISCHKNTGDIIEGKLPMSYGGYMTKGFYLDQHDLIPPPPDEE